ncbi:MAG TPA: DUF1444 family protein [Streptosporangiaceae bacterium]
MSASMIVPVLTARIPVDLQLEFPLPPADAPIREPFAGDIHVSYVLDFTDRYEYVAPRHCAELGLTPESLRERATANLRTRRAGLAMDWSPGARTVSLTLRDEQDERRSPSIDASLVLDDDLMDKLARDVQGDLVVAVPSRTVLVASGTGHQDGLADLRRTVERVWTASEDRLITRDLLVRRRGAWTTLAA